MALSAEKFRRSPFRLSALVFLAVFVVFSATSLLYHGTIDWIFSLVVAVVFTALYLAWQVAVNKKVVPEL